MKLLNEYTDVVSDVVHKHGGRVIDYLGDGIFVLFNIRLSVRTSPVRPLMRHWKFRSV
jgi:class 3 adenylate cyclase